MAAAPNSVTILLVDDDEPLRRMVRKILEDQDFEVVEAPDGAAALEIAGTIQGPIHVLLTDIIMPNLNGLLLAEDLAARRPETAVVFMSGYVEGNIVSVKHPEAIFLNKPFSADRLLEAVRAALCSRQG